MADTSNMSNDDWKEKLTPEQYQIMREKGTEAPFTGELLHNKEDGTYRCAACHNPLFSSDAKFDSGSGWPSFTDVIEQGMVELKDDSSLGMHRTEVVCANCGGHLGHVFDDGPTKEKHDMGTGQRFCINSAALDFEEK